MSEENNSDIRDIEKFRKMREEMRGFKLIKNGLPLAAPLLRPFGVDTSAIQENLSNLDELERQLSNLSELPDKFNDTFSSRGWIVYEYLDVETIEKALEIAQSNVDEADRFLADHYTPDTVDRLLYTLHGLKAFRTRMDLAEKAALDYREERYHGCIPVVLLLADGLVNELNTVQNRGISAEDVDISAWDSVTAHEKGLNSLVKVLFKSRKTTRTEEITLPYRHGIMHGTDLGYANQMVAAKAWAMLFAVRDWAAKVERGELAPPPPKTETSWVELARKISEHNDWKANFDQNFESWQRREIFPGTDIPETGSPDVYETGTPERRLAEFLFYWKKRNYGFMADCIWSGLRYSGDKMPQRLREQYGPLSLKSFVITEISNDAPAVTEIETSLQLVKNDEKFDKSFRFRLVINEPEDGRPLREACRKPLGG